MPDRTPSAATASEGVRENAVTREEAREALESYSESLRFWNAPDDEHTRMQLRSLLVQVMDEVGL